MAFEKLYGLIDNDRGRQMYGISFPDGKGSLIYRAAVEEAYPGEAQKTSLQTFSVRKGEYISEFLKNWKKDESGIGRTFHELLKYPDIDKTGGYCLEIYQNEKDVLCLVPLAHLLSGSLHTRTPQAPPR
jgi:hypothetical protein